MYKPNDVNENPDEQILYMLRKPATYEQGFRTLMQRYQERLYHHIRRLVIDHDDADDVLQNTFLKVHRGIGRFREQSGLFTWMYRIATNEALTFLQLRKKKKAEPLDKETGLHEKLSNDIFFDGDAAQAKLHAALQTLPDKQRLVFNMRYYDEMSYEEISGVTGTSVGALKASYHHAAKKIELYLNERSFILVKGT